MTDYSFIRQDLDDIDRRILRLLIEDARRPYADIGNQVGLRPSSVHARVRSLEKRGVIRGYAARTDPAALGFGLAALVSIRQSSGRYWEDLARAFVDMPEVEACYSVTGTASHMLRVRVSDPLALEGLLRKISSLDAVASTETMLILTATFDRQRVE
ncbi:MAG TPA: Lrp/AsnC family transcriptional regulator [Chloroflexota bacterium]